MISISVVTPWFNHPEFDYGYWEVIESAGREIDEIIVVDDGSTPPLCYPGIRLESRSGFNAACNAGLREAQSDAVLFLNNDVVPLTANWLDPIREALGSSKLVGSVRHERHAAVDGAIVPYIDGWCIAGMREDFLEIGGWEEELLEPAYFGDNLLCLRAMFRGFELVDVPIGIRHILNGTTREMLEETTRAFYANQKRFQDEARSRLYARMA